MAVQASTPPPSSLINPPPAPKLGFEDSWIPFTPRKSARISSQRLRRAAQTPPPEPSSQISPQSVTKKATRSVSLLTPVSRKRTARSLVFSENRRSSADAAVAAMDLDIDNKSGKNDSQEFLTPSRNGMLPTPIKTPKNRQSTESSGISTIARNLFPLRVDSGNELMPSPKKGRKNYGSFGTDEEVSTPIQIYTDSNERIPEVDLNPDNPFYGDKPEPVPGPVKRSSRRKTVTVPGEGEQTLEEVEKRGDGMVYVFRGKRIFVKFEDNEAQSNEQASDDILNAELDPSVLPRLRGPLTRSSIKPRLLFPTAEQLAAKTQKSQSTHDEEEAVTDIEESKILSPVMQLDSSPLEAPKIDHPSSTTRVTRFTKKSTKTKSTRPSSPGSPTGGSVLDSVSLFDSWRRTKSSLPGQGKKREGDSIAKDDGETNKRPRTSRS